MLELHNVNMKSLNVRKNKGTIKCDKRTVTGNVGTAQYEDETTKCEKKKREPLNVTKKLSHVMLKLHNMRMKPSNVRKNKGTIKCDKRIVTCDVGAVQCEDEIVKYEKKKKNHQI